MKIPSLVEKHKHLFGSYSAMALMNIQTVLNHIQEVVGIEHEFPRPKYDKNGNVLMDRFGNVRREGPEDFWCHDVVQYLWDNDSNSSKKGYAEKSAMIKEMLFRSFPFLYIMAEKNREDDNKKNGTRRLEIENKDITHVLNNLLRVLKRYRDYTVHSIIVDNNFDDGSNFLVKNEMPLSYTINNYYTVALRNVKERYGYSTEQLAFIQNNRCKKSKTPDGHLKTITDFNFFLSMQSWNGDATRKAHLSGVGVVQLICFFLEKKYINLFLSKLPICDIYSDSSEERRIIRRSFGINSIKLPKERIHSAKKEFSIALDMLNELKRCPMELFDTLSMSDQDRFRILSSDYNEVLLTRSSDRFAQLCLQYLDYNESFESIRFHVNMGKMRTLFSPSKHCIDGQERVRVIEKRLNGYGRIQEVEACRRNSDGTFGELGIKIRDFDEMKRDDACAENYPYIVDTYTNYLLNNNKIEFRFCNGKEKKIVPEFAVDDDGKQILDEEGNPIIYNEVPDCRMSVFELPAMMFHLLLCGNKETEKRIKQVHSNYHRLITALSNGTLTQENVDSFNIPRCDMPQTVLDAINGVDTRKDFNKYVAQILQDEIDDTQLRIKRLKNDKDTVARSTNKLGTRNYHPIRSGKLAEFLAKDIVKYQPTLRKSGAGYGTDRITGLNYRVMQSSIAMYNSNGDSELVNDFIAIFRKAQLIDGNREKNHPFLYKVLNDKRPKNTVEFYEHYLEAKARYLKGLKAKSEEGLTIKLPFINKSQNKWLKRDGEFYKIMGEIYNEDIAIELPRQMFDDEIKAKLKTMPEMKGIDFENANITYLIGEYLKRVLKDDFQEFYSFGRNYQYIDRLVCETNAKGGICKQYTDTATREKIWERRKEQAEKYIQRALKNKSKNYQPKSLPNDEYVEGLNKGLANSRNIYQKCEKHIRRYKVQDVLFFMLAKQTLSKNLNFAAKDFKLRDIMPDTDRGILSEIMPIDFEFKKGKKVYTIKSQGMKLKNYGDFFALANDKRLISLLEILPERTVDKDEISKEFENYDNKRPEIVRLVLEFEKYVYDKHPDIKNLAINTEHFDFLAMLDELLAKGDLVKNEKEVLRLIRNAFNHNIYPDRGIIEIQTLPEIANHLIEMFGNYTQIV